MDELPPCLGCLGDLRCWVCLGTGLVEPDRGNVVPCPRCYGSGVCFVCQPITMYDVGRAPSLRIDRKGRRRRRNSA